MPNGRLPLILLLIFGLAFQGAGFAVTSCHSTDTMNNASPSASSGHQHHLDTNIQLDMGSLPEHCQCDQCLCAMSGCVVTVTIPTDLPNLSTPSPGRAPVAAVKSSELEGRFSPPYRPPIA